MTIYTSSNNDAKSPARILIAGPAWVGDMVMAQSLFTTLKQHNPTCQIDVLAPAWTLPLLGRMPEVSSALAMPPLSRGQLGLMARVRLGKSLRPHHYDQAILLPNTWKSAIIPFVAHIPLRTGYIGECRWGLLNDIRYLDKAILTQTVQRFVALASRPHPTIAPLCPQPKLTIDVESQRQTQEKFGLGDHGKVLALCPGAEFGESKRWPVSHYAQVANTLIRDGWQVWLFGSKNDADVAAKINQLSGDGCVDLSGKTNLLEAIDLLALVDRVLTNDSGLMHVAAALNKPLTALYGSSDPTFTPPLNANAKIISLGLDCSPCFKRVCPLGHTRCLTDISPLQIIEEICRQPN